MYGPECTSAVANDGLTLSYEGTSLGGVEAAGRTQPALAAQSPIALTTPPPLRPQGMVSPHMSVSPRPAVSNGLSWHAPRAARPAACCDVARRCCHGNGCGVAAVGAQRGPLGSLRRGGGDPILCRTPA